MQDKTLRVAPITGKRRKGKPAAHRSAGWAVPGEMRSAKPPPG
jgi:hypothetical protein